jgi:hypothetical protein
MFFSKTTRLLVWHAYLMLFESERRYPRTTVKIAQEVFKAATSILPLKS